MKFMHCLLSIYLRLHPSGTFLEPCSFFGRGWCGFLGWGRLASSRPESESFGGVDPSSSGVVDPASLGTGSVVFGGGGHAIFGIVDPESFGGAETGSFGKDSGFLGSTSSDGADSKSFDGEEVGSLIS